MIRQHRAPSGRLAKLSHLSLAQNSLRDLRLVARLLQARAGAQQKRQVGFGFDLC